MKKEEIYESLCIHDIRNPNWCDDIDFPIEPRNNCYCDSCFRGKDKLAVYLLSLYEFTEDVYELGYTFGDLPTAESECCFNFYKRAEKLLEKNEKTL